MVVQSYDDRCSDTESSMQSCITPRGYPSNRDGYEADSRASGQNASSSRRARTIQESLEVEGSLQKATSDLGHGLHQEVTSSLSQHDNLPSESTSNDKL